MPSLKISQRKVTSAVAVIFTAGEEVTRATEWQKERTLKQKGRHFDRWKNERNQKY